MTRAAQGQHNEASGGISDKTVGISAMACAVWATYPWCTFNNEGERAADTTHVKPLEPLANMLRDFLARGGTLWACTPCVKSRGYTQENLIDGVISTGASGMHELIKRGAATLSF